MAGYELCSTPKDRCCWLKNNKTNDEFNIYADYEKRVPIGIIRYDELNVTDDVPVNADGAIFDEAKLFNGEYPGPWIQACWGDVRTHSCFHLLEGF